MSKILLSRWWAVPPLLLTAPVILAQTDLETRIQLLENQVQNQQSTISRLQSPSTPAVQPVAYFNPDISLILNGRFVDFASGEAPSQQALLNGEEETLEPGIGLGESELTISSNIDQVFYGQLTAALAYEDGETEVELEEAFVLATLVPGMKVKAGRFLSGFGYLNQQHTHAWDISTAPLSYRYFLGGQLKDNGLQFEYLLPTSTYVLFGVELLQGDGYPATPDTELGAWNAYMRIGADMGDNADGLISLSHYAGKTREREVDGEGLADDSSLLFGGDTEVTGLAAVFKYAPTGNKHQQQIKLQAEYLWAKDDGTLLLTYPDTSEVDSDYDSDKTGYYVQGSYQWSPNWRASLRFDAVDGDSEGDATVLADGGLPQHWQPEEISAALDWLPSEFSRVRMQYSHDRTELDDGDTWLLEYTVSLGAHGAHRY